MKEFFCALEVEVEGEDQCARGKKLGLNQNDASDHFLSAKRLHTGPTFGSSDRLLLLRPSHNKKQNMAKPAHSKCGTDTF